MSYVTDAIDIHRDVSGALDRINNPMIEIMQTLPTEVPNATHVAFTHNGICWELAGLAYNNKDEESVDGQSVQENPENSKKLQHPTAVKTSSANMSKVLLKCYCFLWNV